MAVPVLLLCTLGFRVLQYVQAGVQLGFNQKGNEPRPAAKGAIKIGLMDV